MVTTNTSTVDTPTLNQSSPYVVPCPVRTMGGGGECATCQPLSQSAPTVWRGNGGRSDLIWAASTATWPPMPFSHRTHSSLIAAKPPEVHAQSRSRCFLLWHAQPSGAAQHKQHCTGPTPHRPRAAPIGHVCGCLHCRCSRRRSHILSDTTPSTAAQAGRSGASAWLLLPARCQAVAIASVHVRTSR